jgi:hypothetical protein
MDRGAEQQQNLEDMVEVNTRTRMLPHAPENQVFFFCYG